jgi:hypothetical protein
MAAARDTAKAITYGIESYHAITLHSLEEKTFCVITIEDRKIPRDRTKTITEECVYIPEYAMEDFDNLLQAVYLEVTATNAIRPRLQRKLTPTQSGY